MKQQKMYGVGTLVASLVLVAAVAFSGVIGSPAQLQAQETTPAVPTTVRSVTVVGEGSVSMDPDIAKTTIGVEVVEPTVQEAVAQSRETMQAVLDALMAAGVEEKDIQTSGYNIYAERNFNGPPMPMETSVAAGEDGEQDEQVRYHVTNNVLVTIRDLDSVSAVLDAAIDAGANQIYGINFSLDDPSVVESDARAQAIENARAKAEELAALTGASVGNVLTISEVIGQGGGYFGGNFAQAARDGLGGGGAGPISPGQLNMTMQIQVTYELQ